MVAGRRLAALPVCRPRSTLLFLCSTGLRTFLGLHSGLLGDNVLELGCMAEHVLVLFLGRVLPCRPLEQRALLGRRGAWSRVRHGVMPGLGGSAPLLNSWRGSTRLAQCIVNVHSEGGARTRSHLPALSKFADLARALASLTSIALSPSRHRPIIQQNLHSKHLRLIPS